jgi:CRISPR-associated exonuclease Cas4
VNYTEEDYLQLSGIQHFAFCPRQWALMYMEQQWKDNIYTYMGEEFHDRVHESSVEKRGDVIITRAVPLAARTLGLYGIADVVEFHRTDGPGLKLEKWSGYWLPIPVEYKIGSPKPTNCDKLQLCAQAICLEEKFGVTIRIGYIYYGRPRRRLEVELDQDLRNETYAVAKAMHDAFATGITPKAQLNKSCAKCSLVDVCVPYLFERRSVKSYIRAALTEDSRGDVLEKAP